MSKKTSKNIKYILIGFIVLSIYMFFTTWKSATYQEVHTMYPLEKSQNKEASEEFLKAMEYRIYIKQLHPFFDYDSIVMTPLLNKLDEHYKKGKALLPKDSVEDIVWWTLFYKEIYGLLVPPRNDNSLAYENLPPEEFKKVHDQVYKMIMRYPEDKVYFDLEEIKKFRFKTMNILVDFYTGQYLHRYIGEDKEKQFNRDSEAVEKLTEVKEKFTYVYEKFINDSKDKEFMQNEYLSQRIRIATDLIVMYTFVNNTQVLPAHICYSDDTEFIIKHTDKLIDFIENSDTHQSKVIFLNLFKEKRSNTPVLFQLLQYRCKNLEPQISEIVQRVEKLNTK